MWKWQFYLFFTKVFAKALKNLTEIINIHAKLVFLENHFLSTIWLQDWEQLKFTVPTVLYKININVAFLELFDISNKGIERMLSLNAKCKYLLDILYMFRRFEICLIGLIRLLESQYMFDIILDLELAHWYQLKFVNTSKTDFWG